MQHVPAEDIVVDEFAAARRSLRIAFVIETYPPEVNGVAMTAARIVEGLHRRNHSVQLIRPRQDANDAGERDRRIDQVLTRGLPIPYYPSLRFGVLSKRSLVKLWARQRPDVVHIATEGPLGCSALHAARHFKLPLTSDFRTNFHAYSKHYGVGWLHKSIMAYLRRFHNRTHCTMVPTEALRRDLQLRGFDNLLVVTRGVDCRQFSPEHRSEALRRHWGAAPEDPVVLYVGRLAPEKNLGALITAFEGIREVQPRSRLVVVGDGPLREQLQSAHPHFEFAGQRVGHDLAAHYASADLFVFPSLTETFGNVTTEAMASGLAVVAFDHAAAAQLIRPRENGTLAPFGDAQAFVRSAVEMARHPALRRACGECARETARELDWDGVTARFEAVLSAVIHDAAPHPGVVFPAAQHRAV